MTYDSRAGRTGSTGASGGPVVGPVVSPVMVGREDGVVRLRGLVDGVAGGGRSVALIAGEAGIGKSRLVAETVAYARARGFRAIVGASFPQDRACPFAPILDLLRARLDGAAPGEVGALVRPFARELAPLAPDLVPATPGAVATLTEPDVERERLRLFVALAHCLLGTPGEPGARTASGRPPEPRTTQPPRPGTGRASDQPVETGAARIDARPSAASPARPAGPPAAPPTCLVVEDLHWCDDVSLDFLGFLARGRGGGLARQPLLILATYRAEDAAPALRSWLAQLDRERLAEEIALTPLTRDQTAQLIAAVFNGAQPPVGLVDAIHELAEGNPFCVEELLGAVVAAGEVVGEGTGWRWSAHPGAGWQLPRSLYEAVQQRVSRLSPSAREILTLAAVVGRRFDFELLQRLAAVDERTLLALVKELVAARLVVEEDGDRFAFRHALTRQAVYGELLARERIVLHRTVAEMAEQLSGGASDRCVDDLAYHFFEAGAWEKALAYARRAAERAGRLYAPRVRAEHLTRAIEACRQLARPDLGLLATLHLDRAGARETLGDSAAAIGDARIALDLAQQAGDRRTEWRALRDLGLLWASRDYARAGPCLEAALDLARALGDPALVAHSLNRLGNWHVNAAQPRDALPLHREALAIFERLGDRAGIAATLDLLGTAAYLCADLTGSMAYFAAAAAHLEALDDRPGLVSCLAMLACRAGSYELAPAVADPADIDAGLHDGERAIRLAREIDWRSGEAFALSQFATVLGLRGEYARAIAAAERAREIAQGIGHVQWEIAALVVLGEICWDLLAFEQARAAFEQALPQAQEIRSAFWQQLVTALLALVHAQGGAPDAAAALLGPPPPDDEPLDSLGERWLLFAHAQLAAAQGDPARALRLLERVIAPPADAGAADGRLRDAPFLALARAAVLLALGRIDEAETIAGRVQREAERQRTPPLLWRAHLLLGDACQAQGRPAEAQRAYLAARGVAETLAAGLPRPDLRESLLRGVMARLPRALRPSPRQAADARLGGLTGREREVVTMIARGLTNREIAEVLVVGERTVETHVSNILGKLGLASRREVARWAEQHGLAAP